MNKIFKKVFDNLHWILLFFMAVYTITPFLSPVFFKLGWDRPAWWIQTIYRFLCHQRAERSLFLFGEDLTYSAEELQSYGYHMDILGYPFVGNETLGYKVAYCVRDTFLYFFLTLAGFWACFKPKPMVLKWWLIIPMIIPMAVDGTLQFFSEFFFLSQDQFDFNLAEPFYMSNNVKRAVTGGLAGFAFGLFIFNELRKAVNEE